MSESKTILLFGMPRSGTTWIGKIFDSHKDTFYLHEPDSVVPDYSIPLLISANSTYKNRLKANIEKWLQPEAEKVIASRPFFKKSYLNIFQFTLFIVTAYLCKVTAKLNLPFMRNPIRFQATPPVIVWKSVESLGRTAEIKNVSSADAVQILRHPCGQVASTLRGDELRLFDGGIPIYEDWDLFDKLLQQSGEERFVLEDIKKMPPESRLALRWGLINDYALKSTKALSQQNVTIVLLYEDMCRDPKGKSQELFAELNLSFSNETERFINDSISSEDSAYYSTNKSPLVAAYKWRDQLSKEQQDNILNIVKQFESGAYYLNDFVK